WRNAKRICRLNARQIEMARALGMNPKKLPGLRPSPQQRWKLPWENSSVGGRISLESEADRGSVFQFIIPLHTDPSQEPLQGADAGWSGKRVLIVDDNATNCRIFDAQLRHWGLATVSVPTPHAALDCLRQQRFDLAVFDVEMPTMNGMELAQRVAE